MIDTAIRLPEMKPMLLSERALPVAQDGWAYEVKWDGHRSLAFCDGSSPAKLVSRAGKDSTARYAELSVGLGGMLRGADVILDGEIVCFDHAGRPSLAMLNNRCFPYTDRLRPGAERAVYVAFDILWYRGLNLTGWSYEARREILGKLPLAEPLALVPPSWEQAGPALRYTKESGLEGVVAKRISSLYVPGARCGHWIKYRHRPFAAV